MISLRDPSCDDDKKDVEVTFGKKRNLLHSEPEECLNNDIKKVEGVAPDGVM